MLGTVEEVEINSSVKFSGELPYITLCHGRMVLLGFRLVLDEEMNKSMI